MANNSPQDIATRHQVLLERLKAGQIRDYKRLTKNLDRDLLRVISDLRVDTLNQLTKRQLNEVMRDLLVIQSRYDQIVIDSLRSDMALVAAEDSVSEARALASITKKSIDSKLTEQVVWGFVKNQPISANGLMLERFFKNWTDTRKTQVLGAINNAYKQGETLQQITQRVRGTRAANFRDGLTSLQTNQAEAVIRTTVQHTSSTARLKTARDNADIVIGYEWVSTLDSRTTVICRSLDGQTFKTNEGPLPPIHVGCRSTISMILDPALGLDFLDDDAQRAAQGGPVDADLTYYEWLKTQDREFQNMAIGRGMADLLNDGSLTADQFAKISISKTFKPLTLAEVKAAKDRLLLTK